MAKQVINIGRTANDRSGDPLRTAFQKVNANFTELYTSIGADVQIPVQTNNGGKLLGTDGTTLSWVDVNVDTGNTGFVSDKIYNINGPVLSNDDLVHGATARLELPAYGATDPVSLLNYYGGVAITAGLNPSSTVGWTFGNTGTLTVPYLLPKTFTAVLDEAHYISEQGISLEAPFWEFVVEFQVNPDGTVQTMIGNNTPWSSNPGYSDNMEFAYTEADHGIPGYTFTLGLYNVVYPGPAGWTTNLTASQPPVYPSTVSSLGAIKITSNNNSWVLGTDGILTLPSNGTVNNTSIAEEPTGTIYTFTVDADGNASSIDNINEVWLPATVESIAVQSGWIITFNNGQQKTVVNSVVGVQEPHIGQRQLTWVGNTTLSGVDVWPLTVQSSDYNAGLSITNLEITPDGTTKWILKSSGVMQLPAGGDIVDSTGTSVLGTLAVIDGGDAATVF